MKNTLLLRISVAIILIMHSVPGMFNNGIHDFGKLYLDTQGFAPFGLTIAWLIKLSHLAAAISLLLNRYIKLAGWGTIFILIVGIFMVHLPDGWYVVGGGRNGVEFNFLLIFVFLAIMYPNGINFNTTKE
ncbi:DoxX family protein [Flavobacterium sp. SM15]|uniref:DoxX family protein n=1 Tax=Flavobacterium sp. SM15 TaxID=2908005 RepID=UPI001EDBEBE1|nr:DoxX family protein [Flavobacterium sp. SM15]MCG2612533.1 DoxX family protein [Flavobacterium sp. SM15]